MITQYSNFKYGGWGHSKRENRNEYEKAEWEKLQFLYILSRGGDGILSGETMRSGRRHRKINRRNLHRDREISSTLRTLVRAKWSDIGWGWEGDRLDLRSGRSVKKIKPDLHRSSWHPNNRHQCYIRWCLASVCPSFKSEMNAAKETRTHEQEQMCRMRESREGPAAGRMLSRAKGFDWAQTAAVRQN